MRFGFLICASLIACLAYGEADAQCSPQPNDYVVSDVTAFGLKISKAIPARDKFESDAEYQGKLGKAFEQLRAELGPDFNGTVTLVIDRSASVSFDPAKGILSVPSIANERYSMGSIQTSATGAKGYHGAYLTNSKEDGGTYGSTNGFGAPVQVHKIINHNIGFAWDNKKFKISNNGSLGSPRKVAISGLSGDQARSLSAGLKAVVRGRLTFPYYTLELSLAARPLTIRSM